MKIKYHKTKFLKSALKLNDWVSPLGSEIVFVGYSNVGKSRTLNTLTNKKKLTRVSKKPGRTQLINFFEINSDLRLIDFPGYGYSKININCKKKINKWTYFYLKNRVCLHGIVLLSDIRFSLKNLDIKILLIAKKRNIPVLILLTKSDKLSFFQKKNKKKNIYLQLQKLNLNFNIIFFSNITLEGLEDLKKNLEMWII
ncbi:ribosome biogenesis GTP-binding protein YihA/YsxC [Buchnera aphidicola]|uniref:Probable GTP-binding protein EngB n=1 Tax=Buchnera aphidicola subsp. Tuberolachnus salignus TaxID=98804 RepID=A0A160SWM7_BUCTT|nr:ribosome biogenesis GTP-binding protein YihA/YsxC [Buchnera aphidicola]CUR53252.1 Probable GTP-binding protein EngB [Buchnera aphidicola (Tuberolachnus salignus)]